MPHPLDVKIGALRRKARSLLLLHGLSCAAAVAVGVVGLAAAGDYLLRYEEPGIRFASTGAVVAVIIWAIRRFLLPAYQAELSDVFLARQVERKFPILRERLAGSVAFLRSSDDDPSAGSAELRRTMIHETTQDAMRLPLGEVVRIRPIVAATFAACVVCAAAIGIVAIRPHTASIAWNRLLMPWGGEAWPQTNHLKFVNPTQRVAYGHRFRAEAIDADGAEVDGDVTIFYRRGPENSVPEKAVMRFEAGTWSAEREKVTQDFSYRAIGGDDRSMPWIDVQVVEPPTVREVRWKVHYPAYAHWKSLDTGALAAERPSLTNPIPAGSTLELWARCNKPLASATIRSDGGTTLKGTMDDDRLGFSLTLAAGTAWSAVKSESLRFELSGDDGFPGGEDARQDLVVEPDPAPWIKLTKPQGSPEDPRGDIYITPAAQVGVGVQAGDAFAVRPQIALRDIVLRYSRSDRSAEGDQTISLYAGPTVFTPPESDAPTHLKEEEVRTIDYQWDLKPLDLKPGTFVTLFAAASDYRPQERISDSRRLRVVAPDEFLERMNERQRALHAELNRLRAKQDAAHAHTTEVARQSLEKPTGDPKVEEAARRNLTQALDLQREVAAALGLDRTTTSPNEPPERKGPERSEGVRGRVAAMLQDLKDNRIDNREVESRLSDIAGQLATVDKETKPQEIADKLAEALKTDRTNAGQRKEAAEALGAAGLRQQGLLDGLDAMLRNLAQWDDYGKFHEELSRIKRDQEQLAAETLEHLQKQLKNDGKPGETAQQRKETANRKRDELAGRQGALSRRFEQLQQNMKRNAESGASQKNESLDRAVEAAEQANPSGAMRDAGQMLRDDQSGKAPARQQEALAKLGKVMQALSAQKIDELNRLVSKLKKAETDLASVAQEQKGLKSKFRDAQQVANETERKQELERLAKKQRELQEKNAKLAEELKRLRAERSAARLDQGGRKMEGAGQGAEQGDAAQAEEQSASAERDLENAQRELAQERRKAEADLAQEVAAKMEDDVKASIARQRRIVEEIVRYETMRQAGGLTRGAQIGLLDLAEEQETLERDTRAAAERMRSAAAFKLGLESSAGEMARTAEMVRERRTDAATQRASQNAIRRLQQLLDAIKPRSQKKQGGEGGGGGQGEGEQGGGGEEAPTSLAEIVLIKLLQEDVNARTKELDQVRKRGTLTPEESQEFKRLGEEQGKLAELLLDLVGEPKPQADESDVDLKDSDLKEGDLKDLDTKKPDMKEPMKKPARRTDAALGETE
ncbi:MAG: hypothetical protein K8U03_03705 [Planctomycetia bacterium]|nr:hypothetical protein [Planctomycetia bacterium]